MISVFFSNAISSTKQVVSRSIVLTSTLSLLMISGCQTTHTQPPYSYYGSYYLWIKSLDEVELVEEINEQKQNASKGDNDAELNLLLLYSLPNSPIHNPYTAKAKLNQQSFDLEEPQFNVTDFAFIVMLKDQLNQQLFALNKLIVTEQTQSDSNKKITQQASTINQLNDQIKTLKKQIEQLKAIEQNINEHG